MDLVKQGQRLEEMERRLEHRARVSRENVRDYGRELSAVDNHPAEMGTEDYQRNLDISLAESDRLLLGKIRQALIRLKEGKYLDCSRCGGPIERERLRALPYVSTCSDCAADKPASGVTKSYPFEGSLTWPKFTEYGSSSGSSEQPQPDRN